MRKHNRLGIYLTVLVLAVSVAACDPIAGRETAGEYVDDATITSKVIAEIVNDSSLKKYQVGVETFKNVVQLSGFVDSAQARTRAGELAGKVKGVKSVKNDLIVR